MAGLCAQRRRHSRPRAQCRRSLWRLRRLSSDEDHLPERRQLPRPVVAEYSWPDAARNADQQIEPPKWPWALDAALVEKGDEIFTRRATRAAARRAAMKSRAARRAFATGATHGRRRSMAGRHRHARISVLARTAKTGVLEGAAIIRAWRRQAAEGRPTRSSAFWRCRSSVRSVEAPLHFGSRRVPSRWSKTASTARSSRRSSAAARSRTNDRLIRILNFLLPASPRTAAQDRLRSRACCRASGRRRLISTMARCRRSPIC